MNRPSRYRLERVQLIPQPLEEVFAFFADPSNLEEITPGFLNFRITSEMPEKAYPGLIIEYRLRLFGIPFGWRTEIETFGENSHFTDVQVRGPYRRWHHTHRFWEVPEGTLMLDRVDYDLPLGILGRLAHRLFVRPSLRRIFDHRARTLAERLGEAEILPAASSREG